MNSFLSINVNGVNWYNCGGLTVNATLDNVNSSNYNNVSDINCFTMQNKITTFKELEYEVYDFIASDVLDNTILNQIEDLEIKENNFIGKEKAKKIVDNLTNNLIMRIFVILYIILAKRRLNATC
jgi:hypothetical protein